MRDAKEREAWGKLGKRNQRPTLSSISIDGEIFDFSDSCIVIGGSNGAGKSRILRAVAGHAGDKGLFLDLHHLSEQAMILLRSRDDVAAMAEEAGFFSPDEERREDLERIIGRKYDQVEWSQLDLIPSEDEVAEIFKWGGDQPVVPYFRVTHLGSAYSGREMGLGEFTVHLLLWILEQYSDVDGLTLLLDEPDAFLPPVGVQRLLRRLLYVCGRRGWQLILTTHAEEMIRTSVTRDAFHYVYVDSGGTRKIRASKTDRNIARPLLTRPPVELLLFCEDEAAFFLIESMIRSAGDVEAGTIAVIWGNGHGYIRKIREALPKPPRFPVSFVFVFDGDQWNAVEQDSTKWPSRFLPTDEDPDALFRQAFNLQDFAGRVGESADLVEAFLPSIQAEENHDWVNKLGDRFGRLATLTILADTWVAAHKEAVEEFLDQMTDKASFLLHPSQAAINQALIEEELKKKYEIDVASVTEQGSGPTPSTTT